MTAVKASFSGPTMQSVVVVFACALFGAASAVTCSNPAGEGPCLLVGASHICPDNTACLIDSNICCKLEELVTVTTTTTVRPPPITTTVAPAPTCVDQLNPSTGVSDCPARASLCNDATYYSLMTVQCPLTCGRCNGGGNGTVVPSSTCVDKVNPSTGVSDCPSRAQYCTNAAYLSLMQDQCPKTCGFC